MPGNKSKLIMPTLEEDAKINKAIAEDPDTWVPTDKEFSTARRGRPRLDHPKIQMNIRLDSEVVAYFKAGGKGWQSRINEALKETVRNSGKS